MKIYLATPVNGRKEKTLIQKQLAAKKRVEEMKNYLRRWYPDAEYLSVYDIDTPSGLMKLSEPLIMGLCVELVMTCDTIILDDGWENSQGCTVEYFVAMQYGKQVETLNHIMLKEKLNQ